MAYMSQERKATIAPVVKALLKKHGLKGSLSVRDHTNLVLTIKEGAIDFIQNANDNLESNKSAHGRFAYIPEKDCIQVNHYYISDYFSDKAAQALIELRDAMMVGNHNNSDSQSDYFDVGWYINIHVGRWNAPYKLAA
jgi:hypothetical protein